jgi:hypothetical protein
VESQRGPRGYRGGKGEKGETGPAGKDGVTHTHTTVLKTKKWEINIEDYRAREILSDGSRMPALNFRFINAILKLKRCTHLIFLFGRPLWAIGASRSQVRWGDRCAIRFKSPRRPG